MRVHPRTIDTELDCERCRVDEAIAESLAIGRHELDDTTRDGLDPRRVDTATLAAACGGLILSLVHTANDPETAVSANGFETQLPVPCCVRSRRRNIRLPLPISTVWPCADGGLRRVFRTWSR